MLWIRIGSGSGSSFFLTADPDLHPGSQIDADPSGYRSCSNFGVTKAEILHEKHLRIVSPKAFFKAGKHILLIFVNILAGIWINGDQCGSGPGSGSTTLIFTYGSHFYAKHLQNNRRMLLCIIYLQVILGLINLRFITEVVIKGRFFRLPSYLG